MGAGEPEEGLGAPLLGEEEAQAGPSGGAPPRGRRAQGGPPDSAAVADSALAIPLVWEADEPDEVAAARLIGFSLQPAIPVFPKKRLLSRRLLLLASIGVIVIVSVAVGWALANRNFHRSPPPPLLPPTSPPPRPRLRPSPPQPHPSTPPLPPSPSPPPPPSPSSPTPILPSLSPLPPPPHPRPPPPPPSPPPFGGACMPFSAGSGTELCQLGASCAIVHQFTDAY